MLIGYGIIAVPSTLALTQNSSKANDDVTSIDLYADCEQCHYTIHEDDARFCKMCGFKLSRSFSSNKQDVNDIYDVQTHGHRKDDDDNSIEDTTNNSDTDILLH